MSRLESKNVSYQVKAILLENLKKEFLDLKGKTSVRFLTKAGKVYAALLVSTLNYGFNVANRAPLRHENHSFWAETGINGGDQGSGHYLRSEKGHPSRACYGYLRKFMILPAFNPENAQQLMDLQKKYHDELAKSPHKKGIKQESTVQKNLLSYAKNIYQLLKKNKEISASNQSIITHLQVIIHLLELGALEKTHDLASGGNAHWLGQWQTPDEVFEYLFSHMPANEIAIVGLYLIDAAQQQLSYSYEPLEIESQVVFNAGDYELSEPSYLFPKIMDSRVDIVRKVADKMQLVYEDFLKLEQFVGVPVDGPKTKYPCLIFDLRPMIRKLHAMSVGTAVEKEFIIHDLEMTSESVSILNNLLLSFFAGLINRYSQQLYQTDYIEIQPQGSFGSLRVSITDTGWTFRISLGLVPDSFFEVMEMAYATFLSEVFLFSGLDMLLDLVSPQDLKARKEINRRLKANVERIAIADFSITHSFDCVCGTLKKGEIFTVDNSLFPSNSNKVADAGSPEVLLDLYTQLQRAYLNHRKTFKSIYTKQIDHLFEWVVSSHTSSLDYSTITSKVETLCRLLQLRYMHLMLHRQILRKTLKQDKHESSEDSTDSVLTSDDEHKTIATRCGMSALTMTIRLLDNLLSQGKYATYEIYFEVDKDAIPMMAGCKNDEEINAFKSRVKMGCDKDNASCASEVVVVDIAAFPRYETGASQPCAWKGNWDAIGNNQRPEVLVVDITSGTQSDFAHLCQQFASNCSEKPYAMMLYGSNNKFGQAGVDITVMGELRCVTRRDISNADELALVRGLHASIKSVKKSEYSVAMKSSHRLLRDIGCRRTSKSLGIFAKNMVPSGKKRQKSKTSEDDVYQRSGNVIEL